MADSDPTDRDQILALTIPPDDAPFLRDSFTIARWGINDDLANHSGEVREPARLRREATAYSQLIDALGSGSIQPDPYLCEVLARHAEVIDEGNEYPRVAFEHDALHRLLGQVKGALA
jgi:hypothetical protein